VALSLVLDHHLNHQNDLLGGMVKRGAVVDDGVTIAAA
jgi:hypothetical protein